MTELWQWFGVVGGGIIFIVLVFDAIIRGIKHFRTGKKNAENIFDSHVKKVIAEDRRVSCPWILNVDREAAIRERELQLLRQTIISELQPIRNDIAEIKELTKKLHHAQITSLQIKLGGLFHLKFDKNGTLSRADQADWDKWFSDYTALGGNSDIKRMDDLIQAARVELALGKIRDSKASKQKIEIEEDKVNENE